MKNIWLIGCLLITFTAASYAQVAETDRAKFWQKQLNLTDKQTAQIATIFKETL